MGFKVSLDRDILFLFNLKGHHIYIYVIMPFCIIICRLIMDTFIQTSQENMVTVQDGIPGGSCVWYEAVQAWVKGGSKRS